MEISLGSKFSPLLTSGLMIPFPSSTGPESRGREEVPRLREGRLPDGAGQGGEEVLAQELLPLLRVQQELDVSLPTHEALVLMSKQLMWLLDFLQRWYVSEPRKHSVLQATLQDSLCAKSRWGEQRTGEAAQAWNDHPRESASRTAARCGAIVG